MENVKYREVLPCGILTVQGEKYYLLSPRPLEGEDWEVGMFRFVVVRYEPIDFSQEFQTNVHSPASHLVTTPPFNIRFIGDMKPITVKLALHDLSLEEWKVQEEIVEMIKPTEKWAFDYQKGIKENAG